METPLGSYMWGTDTMVVFNLGNDGDVHAMLLSRPNPGDWLAADLSAAARAPTKPVIPNPNEAQTLTGYPFIVLDQHGQPIEDTAHVVYLGLDGSLHELYAPGNTSNLQWTDRALPTAVRPLGGLPLTGASPTTPLAGYPFVVYNSDFSLLESTEHVIYLDINGSLRELWLKPGSDWRDNPLPTAGQPLVTGALTTPIAAYRFVNYYGGGGSAIESTEHVIYIDTNNRLHELYHHAGAGSWIDHTLPGTPLVTEEVTTPLTAYTFFAAENDGTMTELSEHIIYIGMDGRLHELYNVRQPNQTGWIDHVLPAAAPLITPVQTTPLAGFSFFSADMFYTSGGDFNTTSYDVHECSQHVMYLDADANLRELYLVRPGGPGWIDHALPTAARPLFVPPSITGGPPAETTPLTGYSFVVNYDDGSLAESSLHVMYIDGDKNLHEMYLVRPGDGGWIDRNLTAQIGVKPAA